MRWFTMGCVLLFLIPVTLYLRKRSIPKQLVSKWKIIIYATVPLSIFLLYFLAFYPACMSPDSIKQWKEVQALSFHDWHPVGHTLFIWITTLLWNSPAAFSIVQMVIMATMFAYMSYSFEKYGVRKWVIWCALGIVSLSPINGIYSVTMWKDVLYSVMLCLLCLLFFHISYTDGKWLHEATNKLLFLLSSLGVVLFRHNGIYVYVVCAFFLFLLYRKKIAVLHWMTIGVVIVYMLFTGPIYTMLDVKPGRFSEKISIPLQQIAAVLVHNGQINAQQTEYMNTLLPLDRWKHDYKPSISDPIKFDLAFNQLFLTEHKSQFFKYWVQIVTQNPVIALKAYIQHTNMLWNLNGYCMKYVVGIDIPQQMDCAGVYHTPMASSLTSTMPSLLKYFEKKWSIFWRPVFYICIIFTFVIMGLLLKNQAVLWAAFPVLINTLVIAITLPAQDFRYVYSTVLVAPVLFLATLVKQKRRK